MSINQVNLHTGNKDNVMKNTNICGSKKPARVLATLLLFVTALLASSFALAAAHTISLTAKTLPNGQLGYALNDAEAVIPGPAIFVKEGDTLNVTLTNETSAEVGFTIPGLPLPSSAKAQPGSTKSYTVNTNTAGTYVYHGGDKALIGLFGALVIDKATGSIDRYVNDDGAITPVNQADLTKQYVLFMVGSTFWGTEIAADGTQKPLWANPNLGAVENDIIRFHVLSVGPGHTFHLHAHRWLKQATDTVIDTKLLADGADSHSFTIKAGSGVGTGSWQYHCHLFSHMEAGMHGSFRVDPVGGDGTSVVGASPYGRILLGPKDEPGLVTFEITDEPASWFRSTRGDAIVGLGLDIKSKSLEVMSPGSSVNFVMSDTNAVHTISTLLWPSGAQHMPFDQTNAYRGGAIVKLDTPGLYVFTCKIHPYMFGAVIVDDPATTSKDGILNLALDLGNPATGHTIDLVTGIKNLPTSSDLAIRLLRTFFIATSPDNWQDYTTGKWNLTFPNLVAQISGAQVLLRDLNDSKSLPLPTVLPEVTKGVGEILVNTQFEKTAGKTKPGTITVVDATNWSVKRKIALPGINMNNPHNMWVNRDQSVLYQT